MSTLKLDTIASRDGTESTDVTNVINGSAKAWVNFNGTGTVAITNSFNVNSITDNGTGNYTVNFTNALSDSNFCVVANEGDAATGAGGQTSSTYIESYSTGSFLLKTMGVSSGSNTNQSARDFNIVTAVAFR